MLRPMVGGQRHGLIEPFAVTGHDLFPRPPLADDANIRLDGNGNFHVGQIERRHIAEDSPATRIAKSGKPRLDDPLAVGDPPGQEGQFFVRRLDFRLLVEKRGERAKPATTGADAEDD